MKKENNNNEKGTFYRIFSFILSFMGLRGLLYFFFPLPEIRQWQELRAGAKAQILDLEQKLNTLKVAVNKELPPPGSPGKISKDDVGKSIKTQAANNVKDIEEEIERPELIKDVLKKLQNGIQIVYEEKIRSCKSNIAYATYCIDNFHKCSYNLNKLFLQAVKTQKREVVQSLLRDFEDKNESFRNLLAKEVAQRNAALKDDLEIVHISEKMPSSKNFMPEGKNIEHLVTPPTNSGGSSTGINDDRDSQGL